MILQLLNVLIGLTLVYLIFSTIASALFEAVEALLRKRGRLLARGIGEILRRLSQDVEVDLARLYEHPLICSLFEGDYVKDGRRLPSYIPAERFARAILMLAEDAGTNASDAFVKLRALAERLAGQQSATAVDAQRMALETQIASYFDASMERVSGWFARYARVVLLVTGVLLAGAANVDTLRIVQALSVDPALADRLADSAAAYVEKHGFAAARAGELSDVGDDVRQPLDVLQEHRQLAQSLGLPLGWRDGELAALRADGAWFGKLVGILLTALALSFGASFWFDLLKQLVNVRSSLKPAAASRTPAQPAGAEDTQPAR